MATGGLHRLILSPCTRLRFGELYFCCCSPLLPGFACSIHATWGPPFSRVLYRRGRGVITGIPPASSQRRNNATLFAPGLEKVDEHKRAKVEKGGWTESPLSHSNPDPNNVYLQSSILNRIDWKRKGKWKKQSNREGNPISAADAAGIPAS